MESIKKTEKAITYFNELKELDTKVLELEKMATLASEEKNKMCVKLSVGEQIQTSISSGYVTFNHWGSIQQNTEGEEWKTKTEEKQEYREISQEMDAKHFFIFCNFMLNKYNERREFLINKINQLVK